MKQVRVLLAVWFSVLALQAFATPLQTSALSGSDFMPGRIIDDVVFYNNSTMTAQQIQEFLNAKVPVCDTDGTQPYRDTTTGAYGTSRGYPPPYICLKDFSQEVAARPAQEGLCGDIAGGTKTAAVIIKDVADACGINPQVLLVMLQKEQSLITDTWPWPTQYSYAMGMACPDTAPCDPSFAGFETQVYSAARQFKRYALYPQNFNYLAGRNNYILYSPNIECGGSTVYIENQATASLYIYTPYQPNTAALNNLYGTGDSCSSYGNRNFWRMFNDWFGPTIVETPTFASIKAQLEVLKSADTLKGQELNSLVKQVENAERAHAKGDTATAIKLLNQVKTSLQKHIDTGKLPAAQTTVLIKSIDALIVSWS